MKLLLYEFCTAIGLGQSPDDPAHSLFREGLAMRDALAADLRQLPNVEVIFLEGCSAESEQAAFQQRLQDVNAAIVIAPEFDSLLWQRCEWVRLAGVECFNCSREAIQLCSDKFALAQHWLLHGIATPATILAGKRPQQFPCVWKPRYGAGSTATQVLRNQTAADQFLLKHVAEPLAQELIEQPYFEGIPASVSFLIAGSHSQPLLAGRQLLSDDGACRYEGGELPLPGELAERAVRLATTAVRCVPGLQGYVGVDLLLGDRDFAIEINPRLTTSYIGLRALADFNLAEMMLAPPERWNSFSPKWKPKMIHFAPNGEVWDLRKNL